MTGVRYVVPMVESPVLIRRATLSDLPLLGSSGAKLARQHYAYDSRRFKLFEPVEAEFSRFYGAQLARGDTAVLVAELEGKVVGYAFVRVEPESFVDALAVTAWIHDIYVDESARRRKVGALLFDAAVQVARELGSSCVMLSVAPQNEGARRMFEAYGLRVTMQEMRMELEESKAHSLHGSTALRR